MLKQLLASGLLSLITLYLTPIAAIASTDRLQIKNRTVNANLSYSKNPENQFLTDFKLTITRDNKTIVKNGKLPYELLPTYDAQYDTEFYAIAEDVKVIDLDADGEPEVLVDVSTPGAHCCSASFIYSYNPKKSGYTATTHFWGNYTSGYNFSEISGKEDDRNFPDLNGDGIPEFVAVDDSFRGEFGSYAASAAPIQIWRYQQGRLVDVTKQFPRPVYQNAQDLWQMYQQVRAEYGGESARGAMAAYVGAKFLLGQKDDAMQRLRRQYPGKSGEQFAQELLKFLQQKGYSR